MNGFFRERKEGFLNIGKSTEISGEISCGLLKRVLSRYNGDGKIILHKYMPNEIISHIGDLYSENSEGFAVAIQRDKASIYSLSDRGLLYGMYALIRELKDGKAQCGLIYNYPETEIRSVKVFLPSRENIGFFKEFVEFCSFYGCNTIMIETGGALEYKRHPEINEGWIEYCKFFEDYRGKTIDVQKSFGWYKNSIHFENGGGGWLTQNEARDLVSFCKSLHMEVIPEVPTLSHSDYILTRHRGLAERAEDPLPDTYCPSNPDTYKLIFDILDETVEVFNPTELNIGHDEYYSIGLCEKCRGRDAAGLYAGDINRIYDYLKNKGVKTMMWGDKLLNAVSYEGIHYGGSRIDYKTDDGMEYVVPETYKSIGMIPKDITVMNWYWRLKREFDREYFDNGLERVIYANFRPMQIFDYMERMKNKICGYCISNWSSLDSAHIQRNGIFAAVAYAKNMFWNHSFDENNFEDNFIEAADDIFNYHYKIMSCGKYAAVIHSTHKKRPHKEFVDGYLMDYENDLLGEYSVTYTDGSTQKHKVYFGLNIGNEDAAIGRKKAYDADMYDLFPYFYEPSYTCSYIRKNGKLLYKMLIPLDENKEVENIELCSGCENITVYDILFAQ